MPFAPHGLPFRACAISDSSGRLGGQNLAALGAAAGQHLAPVGSGHSLPEAVDLGTMTLAGLIGTLHVYTSLNIKYNMLNSQKAAAISQKGPEERAILNYYNRKNPTGQPPITPGPPRSRRRPAGRRRPRRPSLSGRKPPGGYSPERAPGRKRSRRWPGRRPASSRR